MTIDDIYYAAINGEKERLISLLEANEVDINQRIDCGVSNGLHVEYTLLYSVIAAMSQSGFNYEILDILIWYGADPDERVEVSNDAFTRNIPIIAYAIRDYKNLELVEYLLQRGAYVNQEQTEYYADGHREAYPLVYFAIMFWENCDLLYMLLKYGADPDRRVIAYSQEKACNQLLIPLFYSLVIKRSREKTVLLFRYGASVSEQINVGFGFKQKYDFWGYIQSVYSGFMATLDSAYREGRSAPLAPVRIDTQQYVRPQPAQSNQPTAAQQPQQPPQAPVQEEKKPLTPIENMKKIAKDLIRYDEDHRSEYKAEMNCSDFERPGWLFPILSLIGAAFFFGNLIFNQVFLVFEMCLMIVSAAIFVFLCIRRKNEADVHKRNAQRIRHTRDRMVAILNEYDRNLFAQQQNRWWNMRDGLQELGQSKHNMLIWAPFGRLVESNGTLGLGGVCTEEESLTGEKVYRLCRSGTYRTLYCKKLIENQQYKIAELCLWNVSDATYVSQETQSYTDREIAQQMEEYGSRLDNRERFDNLLMEKNLLTDYERWMLRDMSDTDFYHSQIKRFELSSAYEEKLRNKSWVSTTIDDANLYHQSFEPVGIVVFDEAGEVATILAYQSRKKTEMYAVDGSKNIHRMSTMEQSSDLQEKHLKIISELRNYPIAEVDVLAMKPDVYSNIEWVELIYATNISGSKKAVKNKMNDRYRKAGEEKRKTIASNSPLFG